jgi:CheY-like chemotaxis protein
MARVLIAEPVAETRELLTRLLRRAGHEVLAVQRFRDADLLVFEPGALRARLIAELVRARVPSCALLACAAEPGSRPAARGTVADAQLAQPFTPPELLDAVQAALDAVQGHRAAV